MLFGRSGKGPISRAFWGAKRAHTEGRPRHSGVNVSLRAFVSAGLFFSTTRVRCDAVPPPYRGGAQSIPSAARCWVQSSPEEAMNDLKEGRVDFAFIWGPSASWIDKSMLGGAYDVVPVAGDRMQCLGLGAFGTMASP